ncbi:MAG: ABC transporter ATP-binding protein [Treponema sp.]|nr:ABC transporter ATP-binding protein [Treponema sp.]
MMKTKKPKRNNIFQNAFIVYKSMFKRYPTAIPLVITYIIISVALPFINTLIPAMAIKGITSRSIKTFIEYIGIAVGIMCVFSGIKMFCEKKMQMKHTYNRIGVFMLGFIKKAINTDYLNIEPQPKQKIMGKGVQAIQSNYEGVEEVSTLSIHLVTIVLGIFSYGTVIFILDWRILAITLGMFVADVLIRNHAVKFGDSHRESFSEPWRKMHYYERNSMNISAGKDIRIFGLKRLFNHHFDLMINTYKKFRYNYQLKWYYPTISDTAFNLARDFLAYTLLIHKVLSGQIDAATFTVYLGIIASFSQYIYDVSMHFANLRDSSHQFNDYHDFMNQKDVFNRDYAAMPDNDKTNKPDNDTRKSDNDMSAPSIEFRNVSFTYEGSDKPVLTNVSFKINADEKIALVGNNGAGKTTIVKLLCGLYPPTSGEILIDGKSINDIGVEKFQDMISVLFQDTSPIALSIAENICGCEPQDADRQKLHDCLEKAGLLEKVNTLIKKEGTYITQTLDEKGVVLSGGETQKLLLAKAMYKNGPMLILDEPTSALDPIAESRIYEEDNQMADKKTAVFISHRLASTKFCDRILFLDNGKIVEEGSHDQLMKKDGKYREIFDIQSHYYKEEVSNEE